MDIYIVIDIDTDVKPANVLLDDSLHAKICYAYV